MFLTIFFKQKRCSNIGDGFSKFNSDFLKVFDKMNEKKRYNNIIFFSITVDLNFLTRYLCLI